MYNQAMNKFEVSYRSNRNVVYSCIYHCVWCPKYRRPVITGKVEVRLKQIIKESCIEFDAELIEIEVMPDHVHLLVQIDPQLGIHRLIKNIKGRSSCLLRGEFEKLDCDCRLFGQIATLLLQQVERL